MSMAAPQFITTLSVTEMETLIRRAVREAVHEEFARVRHALRAPRQQCGQGDIDPGHRAPGRRRGQRRAARIVAKVDQFMRLCDALEAELLATEVSRPLVKEAIFMHV